MRVHTFPVTSHSRRCVLELERSSFRFSAGSILSSTRDESNLAAISNFERGYLSLQRDRRISQAIPRHTRDKMLHNAVSMTPCRGPGGSALHLLPRSCWSAEAAAALALSTAEGEVMVTLDAMKPGGRRSKQEGVAC